MQNEMLQKILSLASRAPSTHNTQPWQFKIVSSEIIEIHLDESRKLSVVDKESRYALISIGCMLENLILASKKFGYNAKYSFNFESRKILTINFEKNEGQDTLNNLEDKIFNKIETRVNSRGIFTNATINNEHILEIKNYLASLSDLNDISIDFISDKNKIEQVASLAERAVEDIYAGGDFRKEFSKYIVGPFSSKLFGIPTFSLNLPTVLGVLLPFAMKNFNLGPILKKINYKSISSAPTIVLISGESNSQNFIKVGRVSEIIMLYFQAVGYDTSIFTASIESPYNLELEKITDLKSRSQFMFCVGKFDEKTSRKVTARESLESKIIQ